MSLSALDSTKRQTRQCLPALRAESTEIGVIHLHVGLHQSRAILLAMILQFQEEPKWRLVGERRWQIWTPTVSRIVRAPQIVDKSRRLTRQHFISLNINLSNCWSAADSLANETVTRGEVESRITQTGHDFISTGCTQAASLQGRCPCSLLCRLLDSIDCRSDPRQFGSSSYP